MIRLWRHPLINPIFRPLAVSTRLASGNLHLVTLLGRAQPLFLRVCNWKVLLAVILHHLSDFCNNQIFGVCTQELSLMAVLE